MRAQGSVRFLRWALVLWVIVKTSQGFAGAFEAGGAFSWSRSNYSQNSFQWVRAYTASLGYYFTRESEIQFMYRDTTTRTQIDGLQNTSFRDRLYSINAVYHIFTDALISPNFRAGIGQLNRDATGSYGSTGTAPGRVDSVTGILGVGARVRLNEQFGLRFEALSYLAGGAIGTWSDNVTLNFGFSYLF